MRRGVGRSALGLEPLLVTGFFEFQEVVTADPKVGHAQVGQRRSGPQTDGAVAVTGKDAPGAGGEGGHGKSIGEDLQLPAAGLFPQFGGAAGQEGILPGVGGDVSVCP